MEHSLQLAGSYGVEELGRGAKVFGIALTHDMDFGRKTRSDVIALG